MVTADNNRPRAAAESLPPELRTASFFCDLQHSMMISLIKGMSREQLTNAAIDYFIDNVTLYWVVHCVTEEEELSHLLAHGVGEAQTVANHCRGHVALMQKWSRELFVPWKNRELAREDVQVRAQGFLGAVAEHIKGVDQNDYGNLSAVDLETQISVSAAFANTQLPTSQYSPGALPLLRALSPHLAAQVTPHNVCPLATQDLYVDHLSPYRDPLLKDGRGAFRDVALKLFQRTGASARGTLPSAAE